MHLSMIMHVQANLLNGVCNVRLGEGQVGSRISNRNTGISRNFGTGVDRCGTLFAIAHAVSSKNVQGVLAL